MSFGTSDDVKVLLLNLLFCSWREKNAQAPFKCTFKNTKWKKHKNKFHQVQLLNQWLLMPRSQIM